MSRFNFQAETPGGDVVTGTLECPSHNQAMQELAGRGLQVRQLAVAGDAAAARLSADELNFFNRQLAELSSAELPLAPALREMARDARGGRLGKLFAAIADELEGGAELHEAVDRHRKAFPPLYARMIEVGVTTGRLPDVLASLARHESLLQRMRRALSEAASYPAIIVVWVAGLLIIYGQLVVPRMEEFTHDQRNVFSGSTESGIGGWSDMVMSIARNSHWYILGIVAGTIALWLVMRVARTNGVSIWQRFVWGLPLFGRVYRDAARAQVCDTVAMALASGRDIGEALELAGASMPSGPMAPELADAAERCREGDPIDGWIRRMRHVPALLLWSIEVAGPRGDAVATTRRLADLYADRAESASHYARLLLAPLLLLLVGWLVLGALAAVYTPLVEMLEMTTSGGF